MIENLFCKSVPRLQRAWDATSFNALLFCPRYYQLSILDGWRSTEGSIDLEFGAYFASCVEVYKKGRVNGLSKEQATILAIRKALVDTWLPDRGPWGGRYENAWRCTGSEPFRNSKGNRAKCPYSHAGTWLPEPAPDQCSCGSPIERQERWVTEHTKDRYALLRLVAAYCDAQPETSAEGPWPIAIGPVAAVELSFRYPIARLTPDGEPYILCGHMDSIMRFAEEHFVSDNKTTAKALDAKYWATFSPHTQVDLYDVTGSVLWPELNIRGVIIEGAQLTKTMGVRLGMGIMRRSEAQREEFMYELEMWLEEAERYASRNYWPMNRRNCWLCNFKDICAKDPSKRDMYLEAGYERKPWNPLAER